MRIPSPCFDLNKPTRCADLIKSDTPLTPAKISRMLHQLDFKLTVEKQYKDGIEKMAKLYQVRSF